MRVNSKLFTRTIYHKSSHYLKWYRQVGKRILLHQAQPHWKVECVFFCEIHLTMTRAGKNTAMIQMSRLLNIIQMSCWRSYWYWYSLEDVERKKVQASVVRRQDCYNLFYIARAEVSLTEFLFATKTVITVFTCFCDLYHGLAFRKMLAELSLLTRRAWSYLQAK